MSTRELEAFFRARRDDENGLVLATVYDTLGSTYSKTGDRMLVAADGDFQGMLSGGCLEGDLAERAMQVAGSGACQSVTYDLRESDEELWGLGVGCEGLMRIFLQPLTRSSDFQPFARMLALQKGDAPGAAVTVLESRDAGTPTGAALVGDAGSWANFGVSNHLLRAAEAAGEQCLAARQSAATSITAADGTGADVLCSYLEPTPRVLVLGGGLDAEPVVRSIVGLGWRVTLQDHRPAYIEKGNFSGAERVLCEPASELAQHVDLGRIDAVIVMSHHLATDRCYLEQLARSDVRYIGLLGPIDRRRRIVADLGAQAEALEGRLHGPAGLPLGGRGPAAIALSIVAHMHAVLLKAPMAPGETAG